MATPSGALITADGFRELRVRLEKLRTARTKEYSERLREARQHGDAGANDEYLAVLEDGAVIDAQIARLEELLSRARVVDERVARAGSVAIGSTVVVEDQRSGRVDRYRIIGPLEAGGEGAVSAGSAVGEALLGREPGAVVTVELPRGGARTLRILAVEERPPGADLRSA